MSIGSFGTFCQPVSSVSSVSSVSFLSALSAFCQLCQLSVSSVSFLSALSAFCQLSVSSRSLVSNGRRWQQTYPIRCRMARRIHLPQPGAQWSYPQDNVTDFVILSASVSSVSQEKNGVGDPIPSAYHILCFYKSKKFPLNFEEVEPTMTPCRM